jgi:hypothetical protein
MTQVSWGKRLTIREIPDASADRLRDDPKLAVGVALPGSNWQAAYCSATVFDFEK